MHVSVNKLGNVNSNTDSESDTVLLRHACDTCRGVSIECECLASARQLLLNATCSQMLCLLQCERSINVQTAGSCQHQTTNS